MWIKHCHFATPLFKLLLQMVKKQFQGCGMSHVLLHIAPANSIVLLFFPRMPGLLVPSLLCPLFLNLSLVCAFADFDFAQYVLIQPARLVHVRSPWPIFRALILGPTLKKIKKRNLDLTEQEVSRKYVVSKVLIHLFPYLNWCYSIFHEKEHKQWRRQIAISSDQFSDEGNLIKVMKATVLMLSRAWFSLDYIWAMHYHGHFFV